MNSNLKNDLENNREKYPQELNFLNKDHFRDGIEFLRGINFVLENNQNIDIELLSNYIGIKKEELQQILNHQKNTISIEHFYLLCEFFNLNYRDYLTNKNNIPMFKINRRQEEIRKLLKIGATLSKEELNALTEYAIFLEKIDKSINDKENFSLTLNRKKQNNLK